MCIRDRPYEKVSKLEHKADAADAKLQYERNQQEHPEMKKQNMNKHYQKQSIKKEYAAARNAGSQTAGTATKNTGMLSLKSPVSSHGPEQRFPQNDTAYAAQFHHP